MGRGIKGEGSGLIRWRVSFKVISSKTDTLGEPKCHGKRQFCGEKGSRSFSGIGTLVAGPLIAVEP
jgi:hypothetical protein